MPNTLTLASSPLSSHPAGRTEHVINALTIDNLIFGLDDNQLKILLVRQTDATHSGKWALPGGGIRYDESLRDAAYRLLEGLTGVRELYLEQLKTFGRVDRHPNERVVTIAYYALVSADNFSLVADQGAAHASWHSANELPELMYDHAEIIEHGVKVLRHQVRHQPIGFNLLPEKFTLLQLQALYEAILNTTLDKPNFRRKIMKMNLLTPCNEKQQGVPHRAASLYRFDADAYKHLSESGFAFEI